MTTTINPLDAVMLELEPRQRANDKIDRDYWLRTRLTGITATEAKVLHTGSTRDKSDVVKKKIEGDDFRGNKYTDWGSYREAYLLERAGATEYGWLVHAPGNERHLATPDGLRRTWSGFAVVECKTSKHDISMASTAFDNYGYLWQIIWQMYCANTDEAYYVWEQHDDDWSRWSSRPMDRPEVWFEYGPQPLQCHVEHIVLTPELKVELDKMIAASDRALVRLDKKVAELRAAQAAAGEPAEPESPDAAEAAHGERLALAALETQAKIYREEIAKEKAAKEAKEAALKEAHGLALGMWGEETGEHEFPKPGEDGKLFRIGYSPAGTKSGGTNVDLDSAKEANPELWNTTEAARVAYEAARDQWESHAASFKVTVPVATPAKTTITEKKG